MKITPIDIRTEFFNEHGYWPNLKDQSDALGGWKADKYYIRWLENKLIKIT